MTKEQNKKRSKKKVVIIIAVLAVLAVIVILNMQANREKAEKVYVEKVERANLTSVISASGEIMPKKNVNISAHIPGRIVQIGVVEGQWVSKNDFLLKLDSIQYEANADRDRAIIRTYKAEQIKAQASLLRDKQNFERQKKLFEEELIAREQLEAAQANFDISAAQYEAIQFQIKQAEASLQSTLDNLQKTVFYAPIDGILTSLRVEEGEIALVGTMNNPGTILMTIADLSVMEVEVEVDETDVVAVRLEQTAEVRVDAFPDRVILGKVTEIGSSALQVVSAAQESKDFKVVITLQDPPESLKPGLSASADIITAEKKNVLAVPISALVLKEKDKKDSSGPEEDQEEGVYIVDAEGRARFVQVVKGIMGELNIEIHSGLEEGQKVIVGPYSALRIIKDGTLIKEETRTDNK
ncbi:MAG: efflux RND transporter periplasmic adaptor subunit [Acidobacteria bacterium]|nr:efflux RND transporter periplasmic adaptor subunit [Acidobacteriota bacterium]MBU4494406.1 efflux RND transporter periplasmic adaptor subunit [Acidobacteriota bacterium]MCG2816667.1 efflux RND transporter periplasmic adaptor subunit [Candidatus Aminicenantes bacterium]